jgi:hypothetical protein
VTQTQCMSHLSLLCRQCRRLLAPTPSWPRPRPTRLDMGSFWHPSLPSASSKNRIIPHSLRLAGPSDIVFFSGLRLGQRSGLLVCTRTCSSDCSMVSSNSAIVERTESRFASFSMAAAMARLLSSSTCFLVRLACWFSSTIRPGWAVALLLRVLIGIYGGRTEVEEGEKTTQQPSFLAHLVSFTCAARSHRSCHSVTPKFVRWGLVVAVGLCGLHLQ